MERDRFGLVLGLIMALVVIVVVAVVLVQGCQPEPAPPTEVPITEVPPTFTATWTPTVRPSMTATWTVVPPTSTSTAVAPTATWTVTPLPSTSTPSAVRPTDTAEPGPEALPQTGAERPEEGSLFVHLTWYDGEGQTACGQGYDAEALAVAVPVSMGLVCGDELRVCWQGRCVDVVVNDVVPEASAARYDGLVLDGTPGVLRALGVPFGYAGGVAYGRARVETWVPAYDVRE